MSTTTREKKIRVLTVFYSLLGIHIGLILYFVMNDEEIGIGTIISAIVMSLCLLVYIVGWHRTKEEVDSK